MLLRQQSDENAAAELKHRLAPVVVFAPTLSDVRAGGGRPGII